MDARLRQSSKAAEMAPADVDALKRAKLEAMRGGRVSEALDLTIRLSMLTQDEARIAQIGKIRDPRRIDRFDRVQLISGKPLWNEDRHHCAPKGTQGVVVWLEAHDVENNDNPKMLVATGPKGDPATRSFFTYRSYLAKLPDDGRVLEKIEAWDVEQESRREEEEFMNSPEAPQTKDWVKWLGENCKVHLGMVGWRGITRGGSFRLGVDMWNDLVPGQRRPVRLWVAASEVVIHERAKRRGGRKS